MPIGLLFFFQAEFYMGLRNWKKAEITLQKLLNKDPEHGVALYQLSQVYLEQNKTRPALDAIRTSYRRGCEVVSAASTASNSRPCIWGPRCTTRANLCVQIVIQEADILRAMREFKLASQVRVLK